MINIPRGTQDLLPKDTYKWQYIENKLHELMKIYNYKEIRTPIFESTELLVEVSVIQQMLYKKKCTHLKIRVIEALH